MVAEVEPDCLVCQGCHWCSCSRSAQRCHFITMASLAILQQQAAPAHHVAEIAVNDSADNSLRTADCMAAADCQPPAAAGDPPQHEQEAC